MENGIKFELSIDETNIVLAALAKAPYESVANVIGNIRKQAIPQVEAIQKANPPAEVTPD